MANIATIKKELTEMGIEFSPSANKKELKALLDAGKVKEVAGKPVQESASKQEDEKAAKEEKDIEEQKAGRQNLPLHVLNGINKETMEGIKIANQKQTIEDAKALIAKFEEE